MVVEPCKRLSIYMTPWQGLLGTQNTLPVKRGLFAAVFELENNIPDVYSTAHKGTFKIPLVPNQKTRVAKRFKTARCIEIKGAAPPLQTAAVKYVPPYPNGRLY